MSKTNTHKSWFPYNDKPYYRGPGEPFEELFPPLSAHDFFRFLRIAKWNLGGGIDGRPVRAK
jgi:hypothetical protein